MNAFKQAVSKAASNMPKPSGEAGGAAGKLVAAVGVLAAGGFAVLSSVYTVNPGHQAIVYSRVGGLDEHMVRTEGLNFVVPWLERPIIYDCRTRPKLVNSTSGSKDLQMVEISLRVLFKPDPHHLHFIYRRLGQDYEERVLPSIVNEVTKAVVAQFNASELLTRRDVVSKQIHDSLVKRAADFHILLDDVAITHLAFSREYTAAVESKQVAKQDAERSKYIVDKALQEKRTIIIKAEGEAASAELIGNAIRSNPAFIQLRKIDASREIAAIVSKSQAQVYLNSDSLLLNGLGDASPGSSTGSGGTK
jgi:prohibitin 2